MTSTEPALRVEGGRKLRSTLRDAGDDLSDLRAAHKDAAQIAAEASAALAPARSRRLADTIRAAGTKTAGIIRAGNNRSTSSGVPYAGPIHWGWFKRGIKPQPFLSRGAQDSEGRWLPIYETALDQALDKIKGHDQ